MRDIELLNIEFNSSCNLRCRWCSLDHKKPRKVMSRKTLEKIFFELRHELFSNIKRVDIHNGGETLLHPDIPGMLSVIRRYKNTVSGNPVFSLLTNGMLLSEKLSYQIVRSKSIDQIRFSIDGGTPDLYEWIRFGGKWDTLKRNIEKFIMINEISGNPLATEAICIIPPSLDNNSGFDKDFLSLLSKIDKVSLRYPHNWDGSVELGVDDTSYVNIANSRQGEVCFLLERNIVILPDGLVTVCCNDLNARGVFGSVLEEQLNSLVFNANRLRMIQLHKESRKSEIPLCRKCTGFYSNPSDSK